MKEDYRSRESVLSALSSGENDFSAQNLSELDLSGITFPENCDFTSADLSNADIRNASVNAALFRGARIYDMIACYADFTGSNFYNAYANRSDFRNANLSDCDLFEMSVARAHFDAQVLAWLPSAIGYGARTPHYSVLTLSESSIQ